MWMLFSNILPATLMSQMGTRVTGNLGFILDARVSGDCYERSLRKGNTTKISNIFAVINIHVTAKRPQFQASLFSAWSDFRQ